MACQKTPFDVSDDRVVDFTKPDGLAIALAAAKTATDEAADLTCKLSGQECRAVSIATVSVAISVRGIVYTAKYECKEKKEKKEEKKKKDKDRK